MAGPLTGVTVVDLSAVVSGPLTGAVLADLGAEVIKVEKLEGDIQRNVGSRRNGFSGSFHVLNRGKRSIALDLKDPAVMPVLQGLVARADVLIQNFRPGVVQRLGLGFEAMQRLNPRLIYLSISGFGPDGPEAGKRAYDPIIQAYSAMVSVQGLKRGEGPEQVNQLIMDKLTAHTGAQAIAAALYARERTGLGEHIQLSMLDTAVAFMWPDAGADVTLQGDDIEHRPPISAAGQLVSLADGWAAFMTLSDAEFAGLCRALNLDELQADPMFQTLTSRQRNRQAYSDRLSEVLLKTKSMTVDTFLAKLDAEQVPAASVKRLEDLHNDPQLIANEVFRERDHPVAGKMREARPAARFLNATLEPASAAPSIGEHTEAILRELGLPGALDATAAPKAAD
ncbi:CoA transferase [Pseudomonadales bacterium]|nr:CoA transferase [Pseudomonadales bacterium]